MVQLQPVCFYHVAEASPNLDLYFHTICHMLISLIPALLSPRHQLSAIILTFAAK